MLSFRKKTNEPIPKKLTDRRKDGRTDPSGRGRGSKKEDKKKKKKKTAAGEKRLNCRSSWLF